MNGSRRRRNNLITLTIPWAEEIRWKKTNLSGGVSCNAHVRQGVDDKTDCFAFEVPFWWL